MIAYCIDQGPKNLQAVIWIQHIENVKLASNLMAMIIHDAQEKGHSGSKFHSVLDNKGKRSSLEWVQNSGKIFL